MSNFEYSVDYLDIRLTIYLENNADDWFEASIYGNDYYLITS